MAYTGVMDITYQLWDVFTTEALSGNPLAVVPDAEGLTDEQMQRIAREFNLSETSFVLPSEKADVRARYFTPKREVPTAGHPTIGTFHALHRMGLLDGEGCSLELEHGVTATRCDVDGDTLERVWMAQGVPEMLASFPHASVAADIVGLEEDDIADLPAQVVSIGNPFLIVPVVSREALGKVSVSLKMLRDFSLDEDILGVFVFTEEAQGADVQARMFSEAAGVSEDPATGSAHGPLGWYLAEHGHLNFNGDKASFKSHQGVEMGRPSELFVEVSETDEGYSVEVGGSAVLVGEGTLFL